jgi:hypothetical protein
MFENLKRLLWKATKCLRHSATVRGSIAKKSKKNWQKFWIFWIVYLHINVFHRVLRLHFSQLSTKPAISASKFVKFLCQIWIKFEMFKERAKSNNYKLCFKIIFGNCEYNFKMNTIWNVYKFSDLSIKFGLSVLVNLADTTNEFTKLKINKDFYGNVWHILLHWTRHVLSLKKVFCRRLVQK